MILIDLVYSKNFTMERINGRYESGERENNWFFIDTRLKWGKYNPDLIHINASEDEF
jgi:hypothetical protein